MQWIIIALLANVAAFACFVIAARVSYKEFLIGGRWKTTVSKQTRGSFVVTTRMVPYVRGTYGATVVLQWVSLAFFVYDVFLVAAVLK